MIGRSLLALLFASSLSFAQSPLRTVAERSGYTETSPNADVLAFCQELAKQKPERVWLTDYGTSKLGQKLPLIVLGTGGKAMTAKDARDSGKLIQFAFANIHAGEVDGKEALLALARDLAAEWDQPKWANSILLFAPNINPDGNDKMDKQNRTSQNGPVGVGTRGNADGFDLNRDFVKLETAEIRAIAKLINEWDPRVVIDCHTTNGSYHRYTLTYDGPRYPAAHPDLIAYTQDKLLPDAGKRVKTATGFDTFWYGNFDGTRTKWETYPAGPRFGVQWVAMRGRFGILSESYSYASFADRVKASYHFVKGIFEHAAANADEIKKVTDAAVGQRDSVALTTKTVPNERTVPILGYVEQSVEGRRRPTPQVKDYDCSLFLKMEPTARVERPYAYAIPSHYLNAVHALQRHGIVVEELLEDMQVTVQPYRVESAKFAERPFQNHKLATATVEAQSPGARMLSAGTFIVKIDQKLGQLAAYLLEPGAEDGLTTWNQFDKDLQPGKEFPVLRIVSSTPMLTGQAPQLPEEVKPALPITFAVSAQFPQVGRGEFGGITWLPDGEHFLQTKNGVLTKVHARTGKGEPYTDHEKIRTSLKSIEKLTAEQVDRIVKSPAFRYTPDRKGFLFDVGADAAVGFFDGSAAFKLTSDGKPREFGSFNKDGSAYAYVSNGNLFVVDVASKAVTQLTTDGGKDEILNGRGDWVYDEEIFLRNGKAYWWSPDGQSIAFMRFDDKPVKKFAITDFTPNPGKLEMWNYPKSGDPNPLVSIGVVSRKGGPIQFLDLSEYKPTDMVISRVNWTPQGNIYAFVQNRVQTWLDFVTWPDAKSKGVKLFRDSTKAWIDGENEPKFLDDGSFLYFSERSGYKHVYHYAAEGKLLKQVTDGKWEAKTIHRIDAKEGWVYINGTKDGFTRTHFYRANLKDGTVERLSPEGGTHTVSLAPVGNLFTITSSDNDKPPTAALMEIGGKEVRKLDTNPARDRGRVQMNKTERVQIPMADGFVLEGSLTYPKDFDKKKKYPVWVNTYAGPHAPTVRDGWSGRTADSALANAGIILFRVDPRSASGKGAVASWACYKQLGVQELKDLEEAIDWLAKKGYVDTKHVGISGHSYGGYMTAYALTHGKTFTAGIAGAPVTDWHLYDSIYTERYMGLPEENKEGYEKSSVVKAAKNLHGKLLLLHGMIDDNVHVQNSMQFIDALQKANKPFELMVYPRNRHGIGGPHYQQIQRDFILRSMGVKGE